MSFSCLYRGSIEEVAEELKAQVNRRKGPRKAEIYLHCTLLSNVGEIRPLSIRSQGFERDKTAELLNNRHKNIAQYIEAFNFSQVSCSPIVRKV